MKLEGKVALVTGASRGIGRAIALELATSGADVGVGDIMIEDGQLEDTAKQIRQRGRRALTVQADVSRKEDVGAMVGKVVEGLGKIDILVNNAGMSVVGASADLEERRWRQGIDVMLTGVFFCSQAVGKEMIKQKSGKIINIASMFGLGAVPERACYCAAKAGVISLTKVLGCEWAQHNINVNAIAPGYVETELVKGLISQGTFDEEGLANRTPLGRLARTEEIAKIMVFLASEEARYIEGQTIVVDGGWSSYMYLDSWLQNCKSKV